MKLINFWPLYFLAAVYLLNVYMYGKKEADEINVFMLPIMIFFGVIICFVCLIGLR